MKIFSYFSQKFWWLLKVLFYLWVYYILGGLPGSKSKGLLPLVKARVQLLKVIGWERIVSVRQLPQFSSLLREQWPQNRTNCFSHETNYKILHICWYLTFIINKKIFRNTYVFHLMNGNTIDIQLHAMNKR